MVMKKILIALALLLTGIASGSACTGISFLLKMADMCRHVL